MKNLRNGEQKEYGDGVTCNKAIKQLCGFANLERNEIQINMLTNQKYRCGKSGIIRGGKHSDSCENRKKKAVRFQYFQN